MIRSSTTNNNERENDMRTTVLNGLPVTVDYVIDGGEVVNWNIVAINDKEKNCKWLERRLSGKDIVRISEECINHYERWL
jgi:hypothetical protein